MFRTPCQMAASSTAVAAVQHKKEGTLTQSSPYFCNLAPVPLPRWPPGAYQKEIFVCINVHYTRRHAAAHGPLTFIACVELRGGTVTCGTCYGVHHATYVKIFLSTPRNRARRTVRLTYTQTGCKKRSGSSAVLSGWNGFL